MYMTAKVHVAGDAGAGDMERRFGDAKDEDLASLLETEMVEPGLAA